MSFRRQTQKNIWIGAVCFLIILAGIASVWGFLHLQARLRMDLIRATSRIIPHLVVEDLRDFNGSDANLDALNYQQNLENLLDTATLYPASQFFLLGRIQDGGVLVYASSEDDDPGTAYMPGKTYSDSTEQHRQVFAGEGPQLIVDRQMHTARVLVPIQGDENSEVLGIFERRLDLPALPERDVFIVLLLSISLLWIPVVLAASLHIELKRTGPAETDVQLRWGRLIALAGIFITLLASWLSFFSDERSHYERFLLTSGENIYDFRNSLERLQAGSLESAAGFIANSETVTQDEFVQFSSYLLENPLIGSWGFVERVEPGGMAERVNSRGVEELVIRAPEGSADCPGSGDGSEQYPLMLYTSDGRQSDLPGVDFGCVPEIRDALLEAGSSDGTYSSVFLEESWDLPFSGSLIVIRSVGLEGGTVEGFVMFEVQPSVVLEGSGILGERFSHGLYRLATGLDPVPVYVSPDSQPELEELGAGRSVSAAAVHVFGTNFALLVQPGDGMDYFPGIALLILAAGTALSAAAGRILGEEINRRSALQKINAEQSRAFASQENLHEATLQSIADGVISVDREGRVLRINEAAGLMCGIAEELAPGRKLDAVLKFAPESSCQKWKPLLTQVFEEEQAVKLPHDTIIRSRLGDLQILGKVSPIQIQSESVGGAVMTFRPLSDEFRRLEDLKSSEQQFRSMFSDHSAVMLLVDPDSGDILLANAAAESYYGYTSAEFDDISIFDLNARESKVVLPSLQTAVRKERNTFLVEHVLASGDVRHVEINSAPIAFERRQVLLEIIQDVTSRKKMEEALLRKSANMEYLVQAAEDFLKVSAETIDYQVFCDHVRELSGADYVVLNLFEDSGLEFRSVAASGIPENLRKASNLLNFDLTNKKWEHDPRRAKRIEGRRITRFSSLAELIGDVIPGPVVQLLTELFHPGETVIAQVQTADRSYGDFTIIMGEGQKFEADDLVYMYTRQVGLLLQRMKAEEALYESEANFRSLFETITDMITVVSLDGNILFANSALKDKLRYTDTELRSMQMPDLFAKDTDRGSIHSFSRMTAGIKGTYVQDLADSEGVRIPVATRIWRGTWDNQPCIFGISKDLTEEEEARKRFEQVFRNNPALMALFSADQGRFTDVNNSFLNALGFSAEEVVGSTPEELELFPDKEQLEAIRKQLIEEGGFHDEEVRIRCKDGRILLGLYTAEEISINGIPHFLAVLVDITERRQAEMQLRETNLQLEKAIAEANTYAVEAEIANQAKSEFLANMSHEIRTPLNGVIGMTGLLLDSRLTPEQQRYAEIAQSSGQDLLNLINDILDFSKIEAGKLELEKLDFDIFSMMDDFTEGMAIQARQKGLNLSCRVEPDVPALVKGDPGRLRQILTNLTGNAVKFTHEGRITLHVSLEEDRGSESVLRFSVQDTGIGIPEEKVDLLFTKFTQVDASTTREYGGSGLGLAISRELSELMGGQIGVNSREGEGSEFWFTVLLEKQADQRSSVPVEPAVLEGVPVLIVEDNRISREILMVRLTTWGMRPVGVPGAAEGLAELRAAESRGEPYRVAVLDMQMPGMDGLQLAKEIKADPDIRDVKLVMLTSLGERGDARRYSEAGFVGYLTKPLQHLDLHQLLCLVLTKDPSESDGQTLFTRHTVREQVFIQEPAGKRILLVEDNPVNQKVALAMLKKLDLQVDTAANGEEALAALSAIPYHLVLMDVQMPVMDGIAATQRIRSADSEVLDHDVPVVAMTAHAFDEDRQRCMEAGMNDFITKPVVPNDLRELMEKWLTNSSAGGSAAEEPGEPAAEKHTDEEVFNRQDLMERLMGDREFFQDVLQTFVQEIPDQVDMLADACREEDFGEAQRLAHTIKGASANIGASRMSETALQVENAARSSDASMLRAAKRDFELELERLLGVLRQELHLGSD